MTRGGGFSCAGVWLGDKTNWSSGSESSDGCDAWEACDDASDELESVLRCMGRLGVGTGRPGRWGLPLSMLQR